MYVVGDSNARLHEQEHLVTNAIGKYARGMRDRNLDATSNASGQFVANTSFNQSSERQVTSYDIEATPLRDTSPAQHAEIDDKENLEGSASRYAVSATFHFEDNANRRC